MRWAVGRAVVGGGAVAVSWALVAGLVVAGGSAAAASAVPAERFRALVESAAGGDDTALAALREVDDVDGRPVDMGVVLAGTDDDGIRERLGTLIAGLETFAGAGAGEGGGGGGGGDVGPPAGTARAEAGRILDGSDYRPSEPPRPLQAPLRWLGMRLEPLGRPFARAWVWFTDEPYRFVPLALLVALAAAVATVRVGAGRARAATEEAPGARRREAGEQPEALERAAVAAERSGDYATAVRLRFRAGLLRLDRAGLVAYHPSLTTGAVTSSVSSAELLALAADFERIAYGDHPASADDAAAARDGWRRVLVEHR